MITREELQRPRTVGELRDFLNGTFAAIKADPAACSVARERKGLYKPLIEELWPLSWYFAAKYAGTDCKLMLKVGNQGFDAVVMQGEDSVEWMEVCWPIDGQRRAEVVRLLNERGHGPIEVYDNPLERLREVFARTIAGAQKKAVRDYRAEGHSSLALVVDLLPYYHADIPAHREEVRALAAELGDLQYKVEQVALLLSPSQEVIMIKN